MESKKRNELHNSVTEVESESGYEIRESAGPLVVNMPCPNRKNGPRKCISNAFAEKHRQYNELKMKFKNLERKYKSKLDTFSDYTCYVHIQFYLALYMCVFILNSFPCGYF